MVLCIRAPLILAFIAAISTIGCVGQVTQNQSIQLWNSHNIDNWIFIASERNQKLDWRVENGSLILPGGIKGYLRTKQSYSNYRLVTEWCYTEKPKNGGFLLHLRDQDVVWPNSVQVQLKKDHIGDVIAMQGFFVKEAQGMPKGIVPLTLSMAKGEQQVWIRTEAIVKNDELWVYVNGELVNHVTELERQEGFVGVQLEGVPIAYRKIELTAL